MKSVLNLCRTKLYERFFNELLGTRIEDSLFDLNNDDIASVLETEIETLLENYEPRITLNDVSVRAQQDNNDLYIRIGYLITGLPFPPQNIEFLLQPTRV